MCLNLHCGCAGLKQQYKASNFCNGVCAGGAWGCSCGCGWVPKSDDVVVVGCGGNKLGVAIVGVAEKGELNDDVVPPKRGVVGVGVVAAGVPKGLKVLAGVVDPKVAPNAGVVVPKGFAGVVAAGVPNVPNGEAAVGVVAPNKDGVVVAGAAVDPNAGVELPGIDNEGKVEAPPNGLVAVDPNAGVVVGAPNGEATDPNAGAGPPKPPKVVID